MIYTIEGNTQMIDIIEGNTMRVEPSGGWMECSIYQNYTASEVLVQGLAGVVNQVIGETRLEGLQSQAFIKCGCLNDLYSKRENRPSDIFSQAEVYLKATWSE